jgi:hypothetical protein
MPGYARTPDYYASNIASTPVGQISAANVQAAIAEIDTEKAPLASPIFSGNVGIGGTPSFPLDVISSSQSADVAQIRAYSEAAPTGTSSTTLRLEKGSGYGADISGYLTQGIGSGLLISTRNGGVSTERLRITSAGLITGTGPSLGAWTAYTPTLGGTGWAIGNGTAAGAYCQIGKIVHFRARIVFGSTSTAGAGASPTFTIPVASAGAGSVWPITGRILDASASAIYLICWQPVSTTVCQLNTIGTNGLQGQINSAAPFTWAVSDELMLTGTYEAA